MCIGSDIIETIKEEKTQKDINSLGQKLNDFDRRLCSVEENVKKLDGKMDGVYTVVRESITSAVENEFKRLDDKIEKKILTSFDMQRLKKYDEAAKDTKELKMTGKKQVINTVVIGIIGIIAGIFMMWLFYDKDQKEVQNMVTELEIDLRAKDDIIERQKQVLDDYTKEIIKLQGGER